MAYKWARWLHNPCRLGCPPLQRGGQNLRWSTSGQGGYITPTALWVPTASQRGAESEVAHKWARWLYSPYCLGGPHRFTAGGTIRGGPQVGTWLHNPCRFGGCPPLQSKGQNHRWPISGQDGYIMPTAWGMPNASQRGAKAQGANKWARWLHSPRCLGGPHCFRAGGRIRSGPQVGKVAT